jgi:PKD repeat protein
MKKNILLPILICIAATSSGQNWETFGGNSSRNGLSRMTAPSTSFNQIWQVQSGLNTTLGMAVYSFGDRFVNSRTEFSPYTSSIECRDLNTGNLNWVSPFISNTSILYAIGMTQDAVYAHDYDTDSVYALNIQDGSVKWRSPVLSHTFGAWPGCVFACNGDPILNAPNSSGNFTMRLNKDDGSLVWSNTEVIVIGPAVPLAASSKTVYRITGGITLPIRLTAIDINTGITLYSSSPIPGDPDQEDPLIIGPDGALYFWRDGGNLFRYTDIGSGFVQDWVYTPSTSATTPLLRNISFGLGNSLYVFENNLVKRLNASNGQVLSSLSTGIGSSASLSIGADSTVYINDGLGSLLAYSADLQNLKWQRNIPTSIYLNPPLCKEGTMVLTQAGTTLTGLRFVQPLPPVADFSCSVRRIAAGQTVDFFDQSSYLPSGWNWQLPGSIQGSSTVQNPTGVLYTTPGIYPVGLTVQNSLGIDSTTRNCQIEVVASTGQDEIVKITTRLYPNPAREFIHINTKSIVDNTAVEVIDMQGRTVLRADLCEQDQILEIGSLPPGSYLMRLSSYGEPTVRFVKQ